MEGEDLQMNFGSAKRNAKEIRKQKQGMSRKSLVAMADFRRKDTAAGDDGGDDEEEEEEDLSWTLEPLLV